MPAIENGLGVQGVLYSGLSRRTPMSYAETPAGLLVLANGIDPMLRWDGLTASAETAGVAPPPTAPSLGGVQPGTITGKIVAFVRFIDDLGNPSDLSPVSNEMDCGRDGFIEDVTFNSATGIATIRSPSHGLTTGLPLVISGVEGTPLVNGSRAITVVDEDTFTINGLVVTSGYYTEGGVWTLGVGTVHYGSVPVPAETKVARRQILRSLSGSADTLYVDVDTTDLTSAVFTSTATDADLLMGDPLPLTYGDDDLPFASRNGLPPSHKAIVASHKGRIFAAGDVPYSAGHVEVTFNAPVVQGVGTDWPASLAGRVIYIDGARAPYLIQSVDVAGQRITLATRFFDTPAPYSPYTIRPSPAERRLVYFSEPGLPESWPAYNAFAVPECNDEIVGLISWGQYLYVVERRHIHRVVFEDDIDTNGMIFLSANRGSLSQRTFATTDTGIFFLDEIGIHRFDGDSTRSVSQPIQNLFQQDGTSDLQVDWSSDQTLWHAAHDPARDSVRWFVTMVGFPDPVHAICYNYRTERWWVEQYPTPVTASTNATIGYRRSLAGTDARRVICLAEGTFDGVTDAGTTRGKATAITATGLTDSSAGFAAIEGAPVCIVSGPGAGTLRIVASNTATAIEVVEPWDSGNMPGVGSVYQIGGIPWEWRTGWFRFAEDESDNNRDVELVFRPTLDAANLLNMRLYLDHSPDPVRHARSLKEDGVQVTEKSPDVVVDLQTTRGWARKGNVGHAESRGTGPRFVSVELAGVEAGDNVMISQLILNGVETS